MAFRQRRSAGFWLLVLGLTVVLTIEPALFLVGLALGLSGLALTWIVLLARLLILDALGGAQRASECAARERTDSVDQ